MDYMAWVKSHPVETGGIVFVGGLGALYLLGFFSSGSTNSGASDASAFYAAEAAQAQSANQLQAVTVESNAQTAQDLIGASADVINNTTWASTDLATTQANNNAAVTLAPFAEEQNLITTLGDVAALPGTTVTTNKSSSGFFGIGASNKTTTSTVPNPNAVSAAQELNNLVTNGLYASH